MAHGTDTHGRKETNKDISPKIDEPSKENSNGIKADKKKEEPSDLKLDETSKENGNDIKADKMEEEFNDSSSEEPPEWYT